MFVDEIIETQPRDYEEEKNIVMQFSNILKSYISLGDIKKRLDRNGFNGVYLLDEEPFALLGNKPGTVGLYSGNEKVIIINRKSYNTNNSIGIHEMGHAFLDSENLRKIIIDETEIMYGKGLEEGAMALLDCTSTIKNISKTNQRSYPFQSKLFQQLNVLYNYSSMKEYENLLIHLFMEPKAFISLIRDIYEDIYISNFENFKISLANKSAFAMVAGTDALVDERDKKLYEFLNYLNALYLSVADEKVRSGKVNNPLFITSQHFIKTREEMLLYQLFHSDISFMERQEQSLDVVLRLINEILESIENEMPDKVKSKIILPR